MSVMRRRMMNPMAYIENGLLIWWDGINNTGHGHDADASTWADLSGNGNDGIIKHPVWSGGTAITSGFVLNGFHVLKKQKETVNTYIQTENRFSGLPYTNEVVATTSTVPGWNQVFGKIGDASYGNILTSYSILSGKQMALECMSLWRNSVYIPAAVSAPFVPALITQVVHADGQTVYVNGQIFQSAGGKSLDVNTYMSVSASLPYGHSEANFTVHCARRYNRDLSPEEIAHNYEIDRRRFHL